MIYILKIHPAGIVSWGLDYGGVQPTYFTEILGNSLVDAGGVSIFIIYFIIIIYNLNLKIFLYFPIRSLHLLETQIRLLAHIFVLISLHFILLNFIFFYMNLVFFIIYILKT